MTAAWEDGMRSMARRMVRRLGGRRVHYLPSEMYRCAGCGSARLLVRQFPAVPDFDPRSLPAPLRKSFLTKVDAVCLRCGLHQDALRPSIDEIRRIESLGKDTLTTDQAYQRGGKELDARATEFDQLYFLQRTDRWRSYFHDNPPKKAKRVLVIRSWFGATGLFARDELGAENIDFVDISDSAMTIAKARVPEANIRHGNISGSLHGEFLDGEEYDLIFMFHCLVHAVEPAQYLTALKGILAPQGILILSHEIEVKEKNPFHFNHFTDWTLSQFLQRHFSQVKRIADCQSIAPQHVAPFTFDGRVPDYICYK